ncbi:acyl-CoA dehydrogenase family protein [Promethearchaeum syntrophicum]|uniref:Acyl-CoA dehydrogenase family protein n=1 Tax=Promethearchaeum syntrophicum TaxID=2594042 RepID=A0A5B9D616_9ARCH|nr:acyl-CoA dehydrogenase family protein [Candidatus Prometheoarchaeum syntrophicum]QEE14270.1 putative acyl-CoA dehydrogenase [Candidatus Prometheoarchaeum syntrophicum]
MNHIFYSEEELAFRDEVRAFCERELAPYEDEIQKTNPFRRDLLQKIAQAGYMSVHHPPEVGIGKHCGKGLVYETIVAEEISAVIAGLDMARMASATLFGKPVARFGTPEQIEKYLKPVLRGEKIGAIGITEPNVGSDTARMETHAEISKDGKGFVLNGKKYYITNGSQADFLCVFAITDNTVNPRKGMTAFIVEKTMPGFTTVKDIDLMGMAGSRVSELAFKDVFISNDQLLGGINNGFGILMDELDSERVAIAGECLGYARPALESAITYSKERIQFKRPIKDFEGINFKIADMATDFEAARLLTLKAARAYDNGERITKEAAMAKIFASEMAIRVCDQALQILGGRGYEKEHKIERYYRDARLMTMGGGTVEILRYLTQREIYKKFDGKYW